MDFKDRRATEPERAALVGSCLGQWKEGYQMLLVLLRAGTEESVSQRPSEHSGQAGGATGRRTGQDKTGQAGLTVGDDNKSAPSLMLYPSDPPSWHWEVGRGAMYKGKKRRFFLHTYFF